MPRPTTKNVTKQETESVAIKLKRAQLLLIEFFFELSRFNFEKCERMLDPKPWETSEKRKGQGKRPTSPLNNVRNQFIKNFGNSKKEDSIDPVNIIEEHIMKNLKNFYNIFNDIGLYAPVKASGEIFMHRNSTINDLFKELINCLKSLIAFEKYYIDFGQLIPEWRTI